MDSKRKRLTIKEKINVIETAEKEKLSLRDLAIKFRISKNQVSNILKDKKEVRKLWITNNEDAKTVKFRKTETSDIDSIVIKWFSAVRAKNIPVTGVLIQEQAREAAERLGVGGFKASNGWLEKFQKRHNISFKSICGESKSVDKEQVSNWMDKLMEICDKYEPKNIFNLDETGLFFRVLPNKTMCFKGEKCIGGKASKERMTVLLCCNAEGDFEMPVVIGKAKRPRSFKKLDTSCFKVKWNFNKKSWMTSDIMTNWLIELENKMLKASRKILLFMDNATVHPKNLKLKSIEIAFFPPNTTSILQPLDQGIIRSFKVRYRQLLLRHVLSEISSCKNSDELAKSVNELNAINWVAEAVKSIPRDCVKHCFEKAGFKLFHSKIVPNDETAIHSEMSYLLKETAEQVIMEDYVTIDDQLHTDDTNVEIGDFVSSTPGENKNDDNFEENDEEEEIEQENCEVKNFKDALKYSKELQQYFINVGDNAGLDIASKLHIHLEKNACQSVLMKQTVLTQYFCK